MGNTIQEVEDGLKAAQEFLPLLIGALAPVFPAAASLQPFLQLIQVAISGVEVVAQATGQTTAASVGEVANHLTPGQPNSPSLSPAACPPATTSPSDTSGAGVSAG